MNANEQKAWMDANKCGVPAGIRRRLIGRLQSGRSALTGICVRLTLSLLLVAGAILIARETGLISSLQSRAILGRQDNGSYLLPTNQLLRPRGNQTLISGRPVDIAFDSTKHLLAVLNSRSVLL